MIESFFFIARSAAKLSPGRFFIVYTVVTNRLQMTRLSNCYLFVYGWKGVLWKVAEKAGDGVKAFPDVKYRDTSAKDSIRSATIATARPSFNSVTEFSTSQPICGQFYIKKII